MAKKLHFQFYDYRTYGSLNGVGFEGLKKFLLRVANKCSPEDIGISTLLLWRLLIAIKKTHLFKLWLGKAPEHGHAEKICTDGKPCLLVIDELPRRCDLIVGNAMDVQAMVRPGGQHTFGYVYDLPWYCGACFEGIDR